MQKLVCGLAFVGLSMASTGCIITSGDDDGGHDGDGILLRLSWTCPDDATGLFVQAQPDGSTGTLDDEIACNEAQPADILYDAGSYTLFVTPTASGLSFVTDTDTFEGTDGDAVSLDFSTFSNTEGHFTFGWTINGQAASTECGNVNADGVGLLATLTDTTTSTEDLFDCDLGGATTAPIPLGDYTIDITVLDGEEAINTPDPITDSLTYGSELRDLGVVDLEVL